MDSSDDDKVDGRTMQELPPIERSWLVHIVYVVLVSEVAQDEVKHTYVQTKNVCEISKHVHIHM